MRTPASTRPPTAWISIDSVTADCVAVVTSATRAWLRFGGTAILSPPDGTLRGDLRALADVGQAIVDQVAAAVAALDAAERGDQPLDLVTAGER